MVYCVVHIVLLLYIFLFSDNFQSNRGRVTIVTSICKTMKNNKKKYKKVLVYEIFAKLVRLIERIQFFYFTIFMTAIRTVLILFCGYFRYLYP